MSDVPQFSVELPMRCHESERKNPRAFCGAPARWFRHGNCAFPDCFFCDLHRAPTDVAIPETLVYRRIRVMCDVTIAAIGLAPGAAQNEAVTVLQAAVARVGGVLNLHGVSSHLGRYGPPPAPTRARGERDHQE